MIGNILRCHLKLDDFFFSYLINIEQMTKTQYQNVGIIFERL